MNEPDQSIDGNKIKQYTGGDVFYSRTLENNKQNDIDDKINGWNQEELRKINSYRQKYGFCLFDRYENKIRAIRLNMAYSNCEFITEFIE
jgi:hypothetical protein